MAVALAAVGSASGIALGASISRELWGYSFARPHVPASIASAVRIYSLTPFARVALHEFCPPVLHEPYSIPEVIESGRHDPYYAHEGRLLAALADRGLHPESAPPVELGDSAALVALLLDNAVVTCRAGSYLPNRSDCLQGIAAEVETGDGYRVVVVGAHSGQVCNGDTYSYHEFTLKSVLGKWAIQSHQSCQFDIAGWEGLEWPWLHLGLAATGTFCAAVFSLTLHGFGKLRRRKEGSGG